MALPDYVVYPAIFDDQHHDGNYTVTFPDVPDTVTQGETLTAAFKTPRMRWQLPCLIDGAILRQRIPKLFRLNILMPL
ncbi:type II toxin-antitoxin system HicB family antitoxin [Secundilactobacillus similis]|uniref:type II toxin-antitoxin system HicB family antitoxin n=1 Tax=Secundilactobacillus similis TaxID=414682 RepID=UPI000A5CE1E6|nr:hypothetical protein [Secundilactobacillus similis]